jgi:hypothetical protein
MGPEVFQESRLIQPTEIWDRWAFTEVLYHKHLRCLDPTISDDHYKILMEDVLPLANTVVVILRPPDLELVRRYTVRGDSTMPLRSILSVARAYDRLFRNLSYYEFPSVMLATPPTEEDIKTIVKLQRLVEDDHYNRIP